jgi:hypothetical protein
MSLVIDLSTRTAKPEATRQCRSRDPLTTKK